MAVVDYDKQGHIVVIRMNRPDRMNAMGRELLVDLAKAWIEFRDDPEAFIGIITGVGRAFCAGMDVKERIESGEKGLGLPDISPLRDPFWNDEMTKPTIAAVNGYALGGGFFMAMRADLCIAAESAQFEITEIQRGGTAGWNFGFEFGLPRSVAMELALGGRLSARRAYDACLVHEVVPDDQLMDAAMARAQKLLEIPPLVLRYNRDLVRRLKPVVPDAVRSQAAKYGEEVRNSADAIEAVRSFTEKRKPVYQGR